VARLGVGMEPVDGLAERIVDLVGELLEFADIEGLAAFAVSELAQLAQSPVALFYVADPRLSEHRFAQVGFPDDDAATLERHSPEWLGRFVDGSAFLAAAASSAGTPRRIALHPLLVGDRTIGLVGTSPREGSPAPAPDLWQGLLKTVARVVDRLAERRLAERRLSHLNAYFTVSSMLAESVDLADLLEIALYSSMETVSAEAASILLLDDAKESLQFYCVEGPAKPVLGGSSFPADAGVAGRVLQTLEAEIVNDVECDSRFYAGIDQRSGFHTRNMVVVPLVAAEERVGVLEVLNKADGGPFTVEERRLLVSIAEEVAFAIRNATLFDYVVNTYCKRRQGQNSCKGCERPLGAWTPCMRYREFVP